MSRLNKARFQLFPNEFKILFVLLIFLLLIGLVGQISASNGECSVSVKKHLLRIISGFVILFAISSCRLKMFYNYAYVFYVFALLALIIVELLGIIRLGAQRWINLGILTVQPSEPMKIALILALSRYYSLLTSSEISEVKNHYIPILLILFPSLLVLKQPDLGSAFLIFCTGISIVFMSGFPKKIFATIVGMGIFSCPFSWFFLHDYQKNRILTFLDPDRDPCGTGYHVLQSKIAIGSGGFWGKGFLCSTQSKLDFLPEKNTDFIFTTITEEFGFIGGCLIILLFIFLISYFFWIAVREKTVFAKLMCGGLGVLLFLHVFVNIAMVMGVLPVVGIPLPFLSYGGSSMLTFMVSCGLIMSALADKWK
ncbi:MAG: rod shape-determining protein RodA [Alphaproteobacteria bacterium]|nr:rod shape-determining protein RodA [Alphaproteobacteria bacterium]